MESIEFTESAIESISLIVVAGPQLDLNDQVWSAVRGLGRVKCRAEVRLVDPNAGRRPQLMTYQPTPKVYSTIAEALDSTKYQRVVILDHSVQLSTSQWLDLLSAPGGSTRAVFQVPRAKNRKRRIWMWLYSMFVFLFLRTRKNEFTPGAIIFSATQSHHYMRRLSGDPQMDIIGILALANQHGCRPVESISHAPNVLSPQTSTRPIRGAWKRAVRFWFNRLMFPRYSCQIDSTKPKKTTRHMAVLAVFGAAAWMLFGNLNYPLFESSETRSAHLALTLIESGDWESPRLSTWAIATSYRIFGVSPWATRFPIALASMLTVVVTFTLGRRLVGFRPAVLASAFLVMSIGFVVFSRCTTVDASLTTATTITFLIGFLSVRRGFSRSKWALAGLAAGLGLIVKGPVVLALCGPPLLLASWLGRSEQKKTAPSRLAWFALPMLLVAIPWFACVEFSDIGFHFGFLPFWQSNVDRVAAGLGHSQPLYYYLLGIFVFMFPVSYLLPSVIQFAIANRADQIDVRSREVGYLALAVVWIFAFLTLLGDKLPTSAMPVFPLLSLLIGCMVDQKLIAVANQRQSFLQRLTRRAPWELPAWNLAIVVVGVVWFDCSWKIAATMVAVSLLGSVAMLTSVKQRLLRRRQRKFGYGLACVACVFVVMVTQQILPSIAKQRSDLLAAKILNQEVASNATIVFFSRDAHAVEMAFGRNVVHFEEQDVLAAVEFLSQTPESLLVAPDLPLENLKTRIENRVVIEKASLGRHVYRAWSLSPLSNRTAKQTSNQNRKQY